MAVLYDGLNWQDDDISFRREAAYLNSSLFLQVPQVIETENPIFVFLETA